MGVYVPYSTQSVYTGSSDVSDLVSNRFDILQVASEAFANNATSFATNLVNSIAALEPENIPDPTFTIPTPTPITSTVNVPPTAPTIPNIASANNVTKPGLITVSEPVYEAPESITINSVTTPKATFPSEPSPINIDNPLYTPLQPPIVPADPLINSITLPTAPILSFPNTPILTELTFPASPGISNIPFNGVIPSDSDVITPDSFSYNLTAFQDSDLWIAVKTKLEADLINGATGLDATIEAAIYQRHKDRQQIENDKVYQETEAMYGANGFNMPTGAMIARLSEIKAEVARKEDGASLDITISQADLAQKNAQFTMEKSIAVGGMLHDFYTQSEDLSFRIAVETQNKAIEIFNAQVSFFNMKLDRYKTEAAVYASLLQGELSKIEGYKAEVSAVGIQSDAQKNTVEIYTQQLAALDTQVKIYATQLEGSKAELGFEALKIESYKSLVQAYEGQINAEKINVEAYKTQVEAENSKVAQYSTQVDAFKNAVIAEATRLQALLDVERLGIESSGLDVDVYKANIQAALADIQAQAQVASSQSEISRTNSANYSALVGASADIAKTEATNYAVYVKARSEDYRNQITGFTAEVQAKQDENRTLLAEMSTQVQYASSLIDGYMKKMDVISQAYVAMKELQVKGGEGAMNAMAQLAASAMSAVNATASFGFSGSGSSSTSHGTSMGLSENHNFAE